MSKLPLNGFAATVALMAISTLLSFSSSLHRAPTFELSEEARLHVLHSFLKSAPDNGTSHQDTVWAHREYAPMYINDGSLRSYRESIERVFPHHVITFDVVFAAAENEVPWHADFDSLGPFEASVASIAREDFITVHANLVNPHGEGKGALRTIESLPLAVVHWVTNQLTGSFGALGAVTDLFAAALAPSTHNSGLGVGNAFNNLKAHSVTAGRGRISYVVRLVKRDVRMSRSRLEAMAHGALGTRRLHEFARFLPFVPEEQIAVGAFPWGQVGHEPKTV